MELLIGTDVPSAHLPLESKGASDAEPFAIRTALGWAVRGPRRAAGQLREMCDVSPQVTVGCTSVCVVEEEEPGDQSVSAADVCETSNREVTSAEDAVVESATETVEHRGECPAVACESPGEDVTPAEEREMCDAAADSPVTFAQRGESPAAVSGIGAEVVKKCVMVDAATQSLGTTHDQSSVVLCCRRREVTAGLVLCHVVAQRIQKCRSTACACERRNYNYGGRRWSWTSSEPSGS